MWLAVTAVATVLLDQLTKALVRSYIGLNEAIPVIPGVFDIAHVRNSGAAFGMLPGRRELFVGVSVMMLAAVALYWWRERPREWPVVIPLGLVVGGAIGNLVDRVSSGLVTDMLAFSLFSPVFNIADSAIVVGVTCLVIWILFGPTPEEAEGESEPNRSAEPVGEPGSLEESLEGDPTQARPLFSHAPGEEPS